MVEATNSNALADAKKTEGNNEFKKGNYGAAINLYSQAIGKWKRPSSNMEIGVFAMRLVCAFFYPNLEPFLEP